MFFILKILLISIWLIISLSNNVICTKHSEADNDLFFLMAQSPQEKLTGTHDSNTENFCINDFYEPRIKRKISVDSFTRSAGNISVLNVMKMSLEVYLACEHSIKLRTFVLKITRDIKIDMANITFVLHEDIEFLHDRLEQINLDTLFGLSLAEAHLSATLSSNNIKSLNIDQRHHLDQVLKLCKTTCTQGRKIFLSKHPSNKFIGKILEPSIWIRPIDWQRHFAKINPGEKIVSEYEAVSFLFYGTPQERDSDYCLGMLVKDDCELPDTCTNILLKKDGSRGYPLTHRLLMIQIAEALQCERPSHVNFSTSIEKYCEQIFQDLSDLALSDFPSISRDLAMEQITLCGMEGYLDFIDNYYIDLIMNWRSPYGCFSGFKPNRRSRHRSRKSTNLMDHGCDSHASGVAAAALSLVIRAYIENYLTSNDEN